MDFNILVNQRVSNEWGLTLKQAFFFAYLYKLPTWSTKAKLIDEDQNPYHWVTQKKIIEDLPLLNIKPESIRTYFKPLEDKGLIKKNTFKSASGSMMYIQVTDKAKKEWAKNWEKAEPTCKNNTSHPQKFAGAHPQKFADNHSTNNHNTNNNKVSDETFENFWSFVKQEWKKSGSPIGGKSTAQKAFSKACVTNFGKIKTRATEHSAAVAKMKQSGSNINLPNVSTWLNQERWEQPASDFYSTIQSASAGGVERDVVRRSAVNGFAK